MFSIWRTDAFLRRPPLVRHSSLSRECGFYLRGHQSSYIYKKKKIKVNTQVFKSHFKFLTSKLFSVKAHLQEFWPAQGPRDE